MNLCLVCGPTSGCSQGAWSHRLIPTKSLLQLGPITTDCQPTSVGHLTEACVCSAKGAWLERVDGLGQTHHHFGKNNLVMVTFNSFMMPFMFSGCFHVCQVIFSHVYEKKNVLCGSNLKCFPTALALTACSWGSYLPLGGSVSSAVECSGRFSLRLRS